MNNTLIPPQSKWIFFAGGGTGGHLYPGLAIAREVERQSAGSVHAYFIGAKRGIEHDVLPTTEFPHSLLDLHPLYRRTPFSNWRTLIGAISSWRAINKLAKKAWPMAVVGTGGYAAGVACAWARSKQVSLFLHESDSNPGLTTKQFSKAANAIFLGFPEAQNHLTLGAKTLVYALGCPITPPPENPPTRLAARRTWGLPDDAFTVLLVGGSQGARALNEAAAGWCREGLPPKVALIWATGKAQSEAFMQFDGAMTRVRPYLSPINDAYAVADLAVTRAGANTIAELCAWGIPSVLVPLPTAAQDHQTHNARALESAGAAVHLPQSELTPHSLDATVRELMERPAIMMNMAQSAILRGRPTAAADIAHQILAMVAV